MKKWSLLFLIFYLKSCSQVDDLRPPNSRAYPDNPAISDHNGMPASQSTFYFPKAELPDTLETPQYFQIWDFTNEWYSKVLHIAKEPVLYNLYLNRELFRFTWIRSWDTQVILTLEKSDAGVTLTEKELAKKLVAENKLSYELVSQKVKTIDGRFWEQYQQILSKHNYHQLLMYKVNRRGTDGAQWILEQHSQNGYHVVNRWTPGVIDDFEFREICDQLIDISSFKKDTRY